LANYGSDATNCYVYCNISSQAEVDGISNCLVNQVGIYRVGVTCSADKATSDSVRYRRARSAWITMSGVIMVAILVMGM
jgi:hypothetical protein